MYNVNYGMYSNYEVESGKEVKTEFKESATKMECPMINGMECAPVMECPQERCIHREIVHHVPHVCPVNTRIINHHIYKHTYSPCYTCTEENEFTNVSEGCCNNF